ILDALRRTPHSSHLSLPESLNWINRLDPARAILTNLHVDLDWETVNAETPDHICPAWDGMVVELSDG
ncbi:MAG: MBL fold metallo-hydrolase, partial [Pseudomonadota bacterium]